VASVADAWSEILSEQKHQTSVSIRDMIEVSLARSFAQSVSVRKSTTEGGDR
jgi:hypothetical protein